MHLILFNSKSFPFYFSSKVKLNMIFIVIFVPWPKLMSIKYISVIRNILWAFNNKMLDWFVLLFSWQKDVRLHMQIDTWYEKTFIINEKYEI